MNPGNISPERITRTTPERVVDMAAFRAKIIDLIKQHKCDNILSTEELNLLLEGKLTEDQVTAMVENLTEADEAMWHSAVEAYTEGSVPREDYDAYSAEVDASGNEVRNRFRKIITQALGRAWSEENNRRSQGRQVED